MTAAKQLDPQTLGLSPNETACLRYMFENSGAECETYFYFRAFEKALGLTRFDVRPAVRKLAARGLAEYGRGLMSEYDGTCAGAGYCITKAGIYQAEGLFGER